MILERYDIYKDSGVEWLGNIPYNWEFKRIKEFTKTKSGTTPRSGNLDYYTEKGIFWIRTTDLNDGEVFQSEYKLSDKAFEDYNLPILPLNSVMVAMYGGMGTVGKNGILKVKATLNQSVCNIFPNNKFNAKFLLYFLKYFRPFWEIFADSSRKDPNINQNDIKNL